MESKLASYQEPGIRLQLVKIKKEDIETDGMPTLFGGIYYQIRKNRKILYNIKWENTARQKFFIIIQNYLCQTKIEL